LLDVYNLAEAFFDGGMLGRLEAMTKTPAVTAHGREGE